jgi:putative hydrolase of HD superfamily
MEDICNFIFELGQLKRVKHEGWKLFGNSNPESVAEHSLRAAQIGYILAKLEGYDKPEEICSTLVFHDIGECRIGDIHKVARRYVESDEERAVRDQTRKLKGIGENIVELWRKTNASKTKAGAIAKDADLLEMAVTAKEYLDIGFKSAQDWLDRISKKLKTGSAKKILESLRNLNSNEWWIKEKK